MMRNVRSVAIYSGVPPGGAVDGALLLRCATGSSPYVFKESAYSSHSRILERVRALRVPSRIIDIGGGEGFLSRRLKALGHEVVCVAQPGSVVPDFTSDVHVIEADLDVERPDLTGGFDVAICGDVLEHLKDPACTLTWLVQLLGPRGVLIASVPNGVHLYVRLRVLFGDFPQHDRGLFDRTHLHFLALGRWKDLFSTCGFQVTDVTVTPVPFSLVFQSSVSNALERLALIGAYTWKTLLAYQFVITAKPKLQ